jgi:hypothetical protein
VEDGNKGMENATRANAQDVREQYERQLKELQEAYGEAMLELRARGIAASAGRGREVIETIRQRDLRRRNRTAVSESFSAN